MDGLGAAIAFGLAGAIIAVVSPAVFVWLFGRQQGKREDKVTTQLAAVAATNEANRRVINDKLDVIHTLVNDKLTKALSGHRMALAAQLAMMEDQENNGDRDVVIRALRVEINALDATLAARAKQDVIANEQIEQVERDVANRESGG